MIDPTDYALTIDQARALVKSADQGDDFSTPDNSRPDAHVHVRRVGAPGARKGARVAVMMHGENPQAMLVSLISAPQARMLGAALLNAADEVDGKTPLVFFPPEAREAVEPEAPRVIDLEGLAEAGSFGDLETDEVDDAIGRNVDEIEGDQ